MCEEYQITKIVGGVTTTETIENECNEKPPGRTIKQCPKYKFIPAGSSRQKKKLPSWAASGDKDTEPGSASSK
jgi:hypothetical protein